MYNDKPYDATYYTGEHYASNYYIATNLTSTNLIIQNSVCCEHSQVNDVCKHTHVLAT